MGTNDVGRNGNHELAPHPLLGVTGRLKQEEYPQRGKSLGILVNICATPPRRYRDP